jgi:hypothetical protein
MSLSETSSGKRLRVNQFWYATCWRLWLMFKPQPESRKRALWNTLQNLYLLHVKKQLNATAVSVLIWDNSAMIPAWRRRRRGAGPT